MARKSIWFIGEENGTNNVLYQILNWKFTIQYDTQTEKVSVEKIIEFAPNLIMVSLLKSEAEYTAVFAKLAEKCPHTKVLVLGEEADCAVYGNLFGNGQFYKLLPPVTGNRVLDVCKQLIGDDTELSKPNTASSGANQKKAGEKPHILIVDDNAMILRGMKGILDSKYSVAVAASGIQAFVSIGKKKPDLILLDYEMPEMNGKEVLEQIQAEEELCDIPVVFLTSADSREIVLELLMLKPAGYMLKPVETADLLDRLEDILGR